MESVSVQLQPFFAWLLRSTLQASILICLVLLVQLLLRHKLGPRWCHALWLVLLLRMVLPWAPQSRASIFNLIPQSVPRIRAGHAPAEVADDTFKSEVPDRGTGQSKQVAATEPVPQERTPLAEAPAMPQEAPSRLKPVFVEVADILPLIWLAGAAVLGIYICANNFSLLRIVRRERPLTDQKILDLLEDCKAEMGIRIVLGIVTTDKVKSASLFGFVRPRLLLPAGMIETLSREELRYVFLHELAHLKRHDIYLGWLTSILQVLHWFNPLIWLAFYRMRVDRELACDALVLARTHASESKDYGRTIVSLLERFSRPKPLPAMAGILETKAQLKRRITMIAQFKKNSYQSSPLAVILIIILGCVSLPDAISIKASGISTTQPVPPIMLRRVWAGSDVDIEGAPSPDGRYLSYVDWDTGDLAIYEIATGKKRRLTNKGTWGESREFAEFSRWSPDGRQIVYDWYNKDGFVELRIVGLDGLKPRILYRNEEVSWARTYDWSPDGKQILACFSRKNGPKQIVLVSASEGSERILKTFNSGWPDKIEFSPDGRYIAYDLPAKEGSLDRDIFLLLIDENREIPLVKHPAHDFVLGWAPDGKHILFVSDRTGSPDIWVTRVIEGNPQGDPELVKTSNGPFSPVGLGFTRDGAFYYGYRQNRTDVYVTEIDPATGKIVKPPREAINRFVESNGTADYSPDGKYLAYVSRRPPMPMRYTTNPIGNVLCVRSLETGEERQLSPELDEFGWPRWSPDGRAVMVVSWVNTYIGLYQIDAQTGNVAPILPTEGRDLYGGHDWSIDGKSIYYGRRDRKANQSQVCVRDLVSKTEKVLYRSDGLFNISLSPDGEWLALLIMSRGRESLNVMPALGGELRELCRFERTDGFRFGRNCSVTWTADSKHILYTIADTTSDDKKQELCGISAEGGEPWKLGLKMDEFVNLSVHPDGRHIAFCSRRRQSISEVWVMENFLPAAPVAKPSAIVVRQVCPEMVNPFYIGAPSPDGKYLAYSDWTMLRDGSPPLAVLELATGKTHRLTDKGSWTPFFAIFSPDSKQVAYAWYSPENKVMELRIIGLDESEPRVLHSDRNVQVLWPADWSADGQYILAVLARGKAKERICQIALVNVSDGSIRVVKALDLEVSILKLSPDGRYIAYGHPSAKGSSESDIFLLTSDGTRETALVEHPADDRVIGWAPDGKQLVFTSDRTGSIGIWTIGVADGKPQGKPELVKPQMGKFYPLGFTRNGSLYYAVSAGRSDVHVATLDPETGKLLGPPVKAIQRFEGYNSAPEWSPDGRHLVCQSSQAGAGDPPLTNVVLIIRELESGKIRTLEPQIKRLIHRSLRWSPDGQSILGIGRDNRGRQGLLQIDIQTDAVTALAYKDPKRGGSILEPAWAPNGKAVFYVRDPMGDNTSTEPRRVVRRELATGEETELCRIPGRVQWLAPSPDGHHLAFCAGSAVKLVSATGGQPRELAEADDSSGIAWTRDGQHLLFGRKTENGDNKLELWRISAQGGEPQKTGLTFNGWGVDVRMHPDGRRIAFASKQMDKNEVWVMENFLPGAPAAKQEPTTTLRKVTYTWGGYATLSPDGRYMCDVDWATGTERLVLRELATGNVSALTNSGHPEYAAISPNSTQVAYLSYDSNWVTPSLFTVGIDGSDRRLINHGNCLVPKDWSVDGKDILAIEYDKDPKQLVWVSATDGSIRHIVSLDNVTWMRGEGIPGKFDVSPDGRLVAYDRRQDEDTTKRDIFLFDLQDNRESVLSQHRANDRLLGWTPDGQSIFFASDRAGTWDAWLQRVTNGVPQGFPELIKQNIGDIVPIGFAQGGSFYYQTSGKPMRDVFIATLDLEKGEVLASPMPVCQTGMSNFPDWSPDGRELAYCTGRPGESKTIHIRDTATGKEREIDTDGKIFAFLRWSPDGRSILGATGEEPPHSIHKIDVQTGERTILVEGATVGLGRCELFADGKTLLFAGNGGYVIRNLTTGREEDLVRAERGLRLRGFALSPDKQRLVYITSVGSSVRSQALNIVPTAGGEPRKLLQFDESEQMWLFSPAWMPDGQDVLFAKWLMDDRGGELWRISAQGGEARKVWAWKKPFISLSVHPDGKRIAFHTSTTLDEMWVLENFLPGEVASAAGK